MGKKVFLLLTTSRTAALEILCAYLVRGYRWPKKGGIVKLWKLIIRGVCVHRQQHVKYVTSLCVIGASTTALPGQFQHLRLIFAHEMPVRVNTTHTELTHQSYLGLGFHESTARISQARRPGASRSRSRNLAGATRTMFVQH
ncbi:hypothetical protein F5B21DRAFT_30106 [Xylaria acuta]|nr:hypothetical protein F5B21DRAFT_30106 [Xylaria acuta]